MNKWEPKIGDKFTSKVTVSIHTIKAIYDDEPNDTCIRDEDDNLFSIKMCKKYESEGSK